MGSTIIFMNTFFAKFINFLHMGGYALYVWSAYSIAIGTLILTLLFSRKQRQKTFKFLKEKLNNSNDTSTKKA